MGLSQVVLELLFQSGHIFNQHSHTQNHVVHIIIDNSWRGSLQDVVAGRGADVGSDHALFMAKVKLDHH